MASTRDRLLAAAASLLDQGGVEAVTLRDVGRMAGVSHNAPYKHFADKTALLAAVAANELRALARRLERARRDALDPIAAMAAAGRGYVRWAAAHPERFKLTFSRLDVDDPDVGDAAAAARVTFFQPFLAAARAGLLRDNDAGRVAVRVWTAAHGAVDLDLAGHLRKGGTVATPESIVEDLVALETRRRTRL
jgi:AcrR family transcriptional regulator